MTTVKRGKLVTFGDGQQRFFPALSPSPGGALDSAHAEREDDDELAWRLARDAEVDAREAALDYREAAADEGKEEDEEAKDRKIARAARAIARDKRAHDLRARAAGDDGLSEALHRQERDQTRDRRTHDALPDPEDHRRDFRPNAEDSRGMAQDRARRGQRLTREQADLLAGASEELKANTTHPHRNH